MTRRSERGNERESAKRGRQANRCFSQVVHAWLHYDPRRLEHFFCGSGIEPTRYSVLSPAQNINIFRSVDPTAVQPITAGKTPSSFSQQERDSQSHCRCARARPSKSRGRGKNKPHPVIGSLAHTPHRNATLKLKLSRPNHAPPPPRLSHFISKHVLAGGATEPLGN